MNPRILCCLSFLAIDALFLMFLIWVIARVF